MKFYGHGVLILGEDKIRFAKVPGTGVYDFGVYESENVEISKKLIKMGYKYEGELKEAKKVTPKKATPKKAEDKNDKQD